MQTNFAPPLGVILPGTVQPPLTQGGRSLQDSAGATPKTAAELEAAAAKTAATARDFESVFVSMMLKTMRQSMSEDMFAGDDSDTFGGMFDSFMGQHISDNGGIGLVKFLEEAGATSAANSVLSAEQSRDTASLLPPPIRGEQSEGKQEQQLKAYEYAKSIGQ